MIFISSLHDLVLQGAVEWQTVKVLVLWYFTVSYTNTNFFFHFKYFPKWPTDATTFLVFMICSFFPSYLSPSVYLGTKIKISLQNQAVFYVAVQSALLSTKLQWPLSLPNFKIWWNCSADMNRNVKDYLILKVDFDFAIPRITLA